MRRYNLYGCLAVLAVVATIGLGLPAVDRALPGRRSIHPGDRIQIAYGTSLTAVGGTVMDLAKTSPALHRVVLVVRGARVVAEASEYTGSPAGLAGQLRRKIRSNPGYQASGADHPTRTADGVDGLHGSYSTPGRVGMYAVFVHGGVGVQISIAGSVTDLRRNNDALLAMVHSVRFGAP